MLKLLPLLLLTTQAQAATSECVTFEIWKGGDDGLTNRVFDQLDAYNRGRQACDKRADCKKLFMLIPTHVTGIEGGDNKAQVPIEIYSDISDPSTLMEKYTVVCDLTQNDCGEKAFTHKTPK